MNREGELRKQEIESALQQNDMSRVDALQHRNQKKLSKLGKELDKLLTDQALIDEAEQMNAKLHMKDAVVLKEELIDEAEQLNKKLHNKK